MLLIFGLNAWPSKWFTATKGLFKDPAIALPAFKPTVRQTINPGPANYKLRTKIGIGQAYLYRGTPKTRDYSTPVPGPGCYIK